MCWHHVYFLVNGKTISHGRDYQDEELYSFLKISGLGDDLGIKIMSQLHM